LARARAELDIQLESGMEIAVVMSLFSGSIPGTLLPSSVRTTARRPRLYHRPLVSVASVSRGGADDDPGNDNAGGGGVNDGSSTEAFDGIDCGAFKLGQLSMGKQAQRIAAFLESTNEAEGGGAGGPDVSKELQKGPENAFSETWAKAEASFDAGASEAETRAILLEASSAFVSSVIQQVAPTHPKNSSARARLAVVCTFSGRSAYSRHPSVIRALPAPRANLFVQRVPPASAVPSGLRPVAASIGGGARVRRLG